MKVKFEDEARALGLRIKNLRTERDWSQAELARRASSRGKTVTQQNVGDYELGKAQRPRYLPEIARAFGTTVEALHGREAISEEAIHLDPEIEKELTKIANAKGTSLVGLVNQLLRINLEMVKVVS